jgi:hypothetical protein
LRCKKSWSGQSAGIGSGGRRTPAGGYPWRARRMILASDLCRARPALRHGCRCGLTAGRKFWSGSDGSAGRSSGRCVWDPRNTRRDAASQFTNPFKPFLSQAIHLSEPYLKEQKKPFNDLNLEFKDYYMTRDVCKVLKILPDTFRQRIYRGYYPEYQKIGVKRIFTLVQIKELIKITETLIEKGILTATKIKNP